MLGDRYLGMGQARVDKEVREVRYQAPSNSKDSTPRHLQARRWVGLYSLERVRRLRKTGKA